MATCKCRKMLSLIPSIALNTAFIFLVFLSHRMGFQYTKPSASPPKSDACTSLHEHVDKCRYVETHSACKPKGYINYLHIFYCELADTPPGFGHVALLLWLFVLFYLLADTASEYFCPSLDGLSKTLRLSPEVSGITLLSLGNGAPDVFATVISFTRSGDAGLGLNSVLGGAFFVSTVVVGIVSLLVSPAGRAGRLDGTGFLRDVGFFLVALVSLLAVFIVQKVSLVGAVGFFAVYLVYVCSVSATHLLVSQRMSENPDDNNDTMIPQSTPLLLDKTPILEEGKLLTATKTATKLLELPLYLPRRLTIPMATPDQWSKPYAVASVTFAPILAAFLCNTQREEEPRAVLVTYMAAVLTGLVFGNTAYVTTSRDGPPRQCLFPWLVAGFLMSVTWTYIAAEELVSLLFSLGNVFGVSPSVLGVTLLAWGNSVGDLVANVAMAVKGGPAGAQVAVSGCYAGPLFNVVVGVGFSLVVSAWSEYPNTYEVILNGSSLYVTVGFLMGGLVWALVVLPSAGMRLNRRLGIGLLAIYSCFLLLRLTGILNDPAKS